jgi:hypothetical protein
MKSSLKLKINNRSGRAVSNMTPVPYKGTPDCDMVDGNRMDARIWALDGYLMRLNAYPCQRWINFDADVPEKLGFSSDARESLILVEKEHIRWLRTEKRSPWEQINNGTRTHFRALARFMAMRGYCRLSDFTPGAFAEFMEYPRVFSDSHKARRQLLGRQLHEQFLLGTLPDGPLFNPADHEPESSDSADGTSDDFEDAEPNVSSARRSFLNSRNSTMPFDEDTFLRILSGSINFIRTIKGDLLKAVQEFTETDDADMDNFKNLACLKHVRKSQLERVLLEFQRACFIVISSTLIGRSNEYLEIGRLGKCWVPTTVDGETSHGIMIPWSKRRDGQRYLVRGRGTALTVEAIRALDEIVAAHPGTRNSQHLFCRFSSAEAYGGGPPGSLLTPDAMAMGLRTFLKRTVGLSEDEVAKVHPHRFRSTAIVNLCCVKNGVLAAWFEARHASLKQLCDYALAATDWLGIEDTLDEMAA